MDEIEVDADLSDDGVQAFFDGRSPLASSAIRKMEQAESWTHDKAKEVQDSLQELAFRMEELDAEDLPQEIKEKFIILLGYISSGKALKLLYWVNLNSPKFVGTFLAQAQMLAAVDRTNQGAAELFVERFEILDRLHVLSKVFSEDRLRIIRTVLNLLNDRDPDYSNDEYQ